MSHWQNLYPMIKAKLLEPQQPVGEKPPPLGNVVDTKTSQDSERIRSSEYLTTWARLAESEYKVVNEESKGY